MNITGNVRYQFTEGLIEKAVINLLRRRKYDSITIKEICVEAGINRSSFYAHYQDINDFMIKFEGKLAKQIQSIWKPSEIYGEEVFLKFFGLIKEHRVFYKAFLKSHNPSFVAGDMLKKQKAQFKQIAFEKGLGYSDSEIDFHLHYFGGGLKAVCGLWLQNDCRETPEQMAKIIHDEYANNAQYFRK